MGIPFDQMIEYAKRRNNNNNSLKNQFELPDIGAGESYELIYPFSNCTQMVEYYNRLFESGRLIMATDFEAKQGMIFNTVLDRIKESIERGEKQSFIVLDSLPNLSIERKPND